PTLARMRSDDPVYWHPLLNMWLFTRYDDIQTLTRDRRFSAERGDHYTRAAPPEVAKEAAEIERFLNRWLIYLDPPLHTALRGSVAKAFSPSVIEWLAPFIERTVDELMDAAAPSGKMDVVKDLAHPLPALVIAHMLGVPKEDIAAFKGWATDLTRLIGAPA